jgi:hypothetical protein
MFGLCANTEKWELDTGINPSEWDIRPLAETSENDKVC